MDDDELHNNGVPDDASSDDASSGDESLRDEPDSDSLADSEEDDKSRSSPERGLVETERNMELLQASLLSKEEEQVKPRAGLWGCLPDEILSNILMRLPMVTQCRYRCVCMKWRTLLSTPPAGQPLHQLQSRPSCTILCDVKYFGDCFFCHGEKRWFQFPKPTFCKEALDWALYVGYRRRAPCL